MYLYVNSLGFKGNIINYYRDIWITDPLLFLRVNNNVKSCTLCCINIKPTFFKSM